MVWLAPDVLLDLGNPETTTCFDPKTLSLGSEHGPSNHLVLALQAQITALSPVAQLVCCPRQRTPNPEPLNPKPIVIAPDSGPTVFAGAASWNLSLNCGAS